MFLFSCVSLLDEATNKVAAAVNVLLFFSIESTAESALLCFVLFGFVYILFSQSQSLNINLRKGIYLETFFFLSEASFISHTRLL